MKPYASSLCALFNLFHIFLKREKKESTVCQCDNMMAETEWLLLISESLELVTLSISAESCSFVTSWCGATS